MYTNGNKYEGEFLAGKRHGQGVYWVKVGRFASGNHVDSARASALPPPASLTRSARYCRRTASTE